MLVSDWQIRVHFVADTQRFLQVSTLCVITISQKYSGRDLQRKYAETYCDSIVFTFNEVS